MKSLLAIIACSCCTMLTGCDALRLENTGAAVEHAGQRGQDSEAPAAPAVAPVPQVNVDMTPVADALREIAAAQDRHDQPAPLPPPPERRQPEFSDAKPMFRENPSRFTGAYVCVGDVKDAWNNGNKCRPCSNLVAALKAYGRGWTIAIIDDNPNAHFVVAPAAPDVATPYVTYWKDGRQVGVWDKGFSNTRAELDRIISCHPLAKREPQPKSITGNPIASRSIVTESYVYSTPVTPLGGSPRIQFYRPPYGQCFGGVCR